MKRIKDLVNLPSETLQLMIDGLLEMDAREDFCIDMGTFLSSPPAGKQAFKPDAICYGCAATCAIIKATGIFPNSDDIFYMCNSLSGAPSFSEWDREDLHTFESAIDDARCGSMRSLFYYFEVPYVCGIHNPANSADFYFELRTANWRSQLPQVVNYIAYLKTLGL